MDPLISFEFSAPKSPEASDKLLIAHDRLAKLNPTYFSVTYGAGGSTRDGTRQAVLDVAARGSSVAPHLSFGGDTAEKIEKLILDYKAEGITRLVALRGDLGR